MSFFTKMSSFVRKAPAAESVEKKEEVKPTSVAKEVEKVATEAPKSELPESETPSEISSSASSPSRSSSVESSESSSEMADVAAEKNENAASAVVAPVVEIREETPAKAEEGKASVPTDEQGTKSSTNASADVPPAVPAAEAVKMGSDEVPVDTAAKTPTETTTPAEQVEVRDVETPVVAAVEEVPVVAPVTAPSEEKQPEKIEDSPVKAPEPDQTKSKEDAAASIDVSPKHESTESPAEEKPVAESSPSPSANDEASREPTVSATALEKPETTETKPESPPAEAVEPKVAETAPTDSVSVSPSEKIPVAPSGGASEPSAAEAADPLPQDSSTVPADKASADEAKASASGEEQVEAKAPENVCAERVEAEIKPGADDSGIQEPDTKHVEGGSGDESHEGEQVAVVEQVAAADMQNVVEEGAVVPPGDDEEEWSDEDEGNASYGDEHRASLPKKSETVSDEDANLDFDEDKGNPQYIPKKGAFYEHDDRRGTDDEDETAEEEANKDKDTEESEVAGGSKDSPEHRRTQRVLQSETKDRWDHDMYDANEQGPKTSDELVQQYGYDIRDESSAPRAAGRRGYGRGPNKYTRDWQDEKAYHGKTHNAQERREKEFHPRRDDFPCLPATQRPREPQNLKESVKDVPVREERQEHPRDNRRQNDRGERPERNDRAESKDPRRSDQGRDRDTNRKDRREMTGPSYPITTHPSAWNHANPQPPLPAPHQAQNFGVGPPPPRSENPRFENAMRGSGPPGRDFAQDQGDIGRRGAGHEKWRMEAPENRDPGRRLIGCGERELRWRREGSGRFGDHRGSGGYDLRNKLDANRHDNQRFDGRKPPRNEGWGAADNGGHRDHGGHRDNGGGRPRNSGDHRDNFRDRENFHRENSHRENWRDNRDSYRDNRDGGRTDNRESGRDARDAGRGDAREGGREIIMTRQDRKIGSGRTQEPRNSRKPVDARNGEFAEQRRPSDDKTSFRQHPPQQNGSASESKRYTQQRAAARGDASQAAVPIPQAQPAAAQAQPQQSAHHSMPAPSRQGHGPQQPIPPQHVPQQQAYYELPPGPAPYFVPQFDGAAGPPQNFIQPNPFMNHPTAYIAPPAPAAHSYMMSPEGPVPEVYAPAPGSNGAPGGITYYSATQQMYMAHQQQSQPRRKAAIPIKPPPEAHPHVEPKPLET